MSILLADKVFHRQSASSKCVTKQQTNCGWCILYAIYFRVCASQCSSAQNALFVDNKLKDIFLLCGERTLFWERTRIYLKPVQRCVVAANACNAFVWRHDRPKTDHNIKDSWVIVNYIGLSCHVWDWSWWC